MISIRRRLLAILLTLFFAAWVLLAVMTYTAARHEAEELFDAQLVQSARVLLSLTLHELAEDEHESITPPELTQKMLGHHYEKKLAFQIWKNKTLLLYSPNAPNAAMAETAGFSDYILNGRPWRVFVLVDEAKQVRIEVGEDVAVRNELIYKISRQTLLPLVLALPLLAAALWIGVGRGLAPLKKVAREISARSPKQMEALDEAGVPEEIKPLAQSLNQLLMRLRTALEAERRFTANAAHELRTPLAALRAQAEVTLRVSNEAEQREALQQIIRGVDRAARLLGQMLTLARLDPDVTTVPHGRVDLHSLSACVLAEVAPTALKKDIELSLVAGESGKVFGEDASLEVLLRNLFDNAIRYTPENGQIQVEVRAGGNQVTLSVMDTGPGIPEAERSRVFDRFYRLPGSTAPGCGLGLSIVQRIAELHGARVALDTPSWGHGLRVVVSFPAAQPN